MDFDNFSEDLNWGGGQGESQDHRSENKSERSAQVDARSSSNVRVAAALVTELLMRHRGNVKEAVEGLLEANPDDQASRDVANGMKMAMHPASEILIMMDMATGQMMVNLDDATIEIVNGDELRLEGDGIDYDEGDGN